MTRDVISVDEMTTLGEIADLLETKRIQRVPVLHDGKIVGIVSRADLLQVLASGAAATTDDEQDHIICARLLAELREQIWANPTESNLVVLGDIIVHFWGTAASEEQRSALRVAAENTPSVRVIEDHTEAAAAPSVL
jgi:CBS domain containing-hemolysin-like protein